MTSLNPVRSVLVTGAGGNLGRKLIAHLLTRDWCERIVALDRMAPSPTAGVDRVRWVEADLADPIEVRWHEALSGIDAAVHFAARNPYPDASWSDACAS